MDLSISTSIAGFLVAAAAIGISGVKMTARAEYLARATGLGQAVMGAVFIGAATSLSGLVTSATAAVQGYASLAASNSLGGIAAQTMFLAVADFFYRRANLEHAAASEANLQQGALLIMLLAIPMFAMATPGLQLGWIHPASPALLLVYGFGVFLVSRAYNEPMWRPRLTEETEKEPKGEAMEKRATARHWLIFAALAGVVATAGWLIAECGIALSAHLGLRESLVGGVFTSISTSLPELVIAIAAVKRNAPTLAVGDIIGGNSFDVLFLAVADILYLEGSLYRALGLDEILWISVTLLMSSVLLMGLLRRQKFGIANVGFEGVAIIALYIVTIATLVWR